MKSWSFILLIFTPLVITQKLGLSGSDYEEEKATTELSDNPPQNSEQWIHSVIFEPLPKVKLTRSSYQVTTFLDFLPFLQGFTRVNDYIENFRKDLNNPTYTHQIPMELYNVDFALHNNMEMSHLMDSSLCRTRPRQCMTAFKIQKHKEELSYVQEIFLSIYN